MAEYSLRELNMRVFQRQPLPHVLFQPRIEPWVRWHTNQKMLPPELVGLTLPQIFDTLPASMRYINFFTGIPNAVERRFSPEVKIESRNEPDEHFWRCQTPYGDLTQIEHRTEGGAWHKQEFMAKSPDDLKKLRWLFERATYVFVEEIFQRGEDFFADRGEPQFFMPRSPYKTLAIELMGFENLIYALSDFREETEELMQTIDASQDFLYQQLTTTKRVKIAAIGENMEAQLLSPRYFQQYLLPFYHKRATQLREAGIFSHIHIDGNFRNLLRFFKDLPFDGLEALTPYPMGDATLEEVKAHIGDKILLDGLPAIYFMDTFSEDELMKMVEKMVEYFHPRLIMGISDELPQGGGLTAWNRCKMVAQYCLEHG